jgi:ribosomal protein S18 acetylase RimI-like enzyme
VSAEDRGGVAGRGIRLARPDDAPALAALAERTFRETFAAGNDPADMEAYVAQAYGAAIQGREIEDPAILTLVAEDARELAAFAQLRRGAPPATVSGPDPVELWRFYVDRAQHGRGLAQALIAAVLAHARAAGARTIWLGVWEHNPRAQAFYRKCGFTDIGAHQFVLGRDVQTDRLMSRSLT